MAEEHQSDSAESIFRDLLFLTKHILFTCEQARGYFVTSYMIMFWSL